MAAFSILVLIVYLTIAFYVVYRARESLIDEKRKQQAAIVSGKAVIKPLVSDLDKILNAQLEPLGLKGAITVNLGKEKCVVVDQLKQWSITIENKTTTYALFVDWQNSSLTNLQGQARSLACLTPNQGASQSSSLTPPLDKLQENFVIFSKSEDLPGFVDSGALFKLLKDEKPCQLSLRLVLRLQEVGRYTNSYNLFLNCVFQFRNATLADVVST
ncbi:MAG: hypothetical protein ACO3NK_12305 [Prochlorotrichaceae cyanobacterium]|jgi:hypothetical protein